MAKKRLVMSDEALHMVARRFRALADPTRLRILSLLMQGEHSVGELAAAAELEQPNVSRHLAVLRREHVVARRNQGNRALYRIDDATVVRLCEAVCDGLADRLAGDLEALPDERLWKGMNI